MIYRKTITLVQLFVKGCSVQLYQRFAERLVWDRRIHFFTGFELTWVHRHEIIIQSLRSYGLVEDHKQNGGFRLGPAIFRLAGVAHQGLGLLEITLPHTSSTGGD